MKKKSVALLKRLTVESKILAAADVSNPIYCDNGWFYKQTSEKGDSIIIKRILGPILPHYHDNGSQIYHALHGSGLIIIGNNVKPLEPGQKYTIFEGMAHYVVPFTPMYIKVSTVPHWSKEGYRVLSGDSVKNYYCETYERRVLSHVYTVITLCSKKDHYQNPGNITLGLDNLTLVDLRRRLTPDTCNC